MHRIENVEEILHFPFASLLGIEEKKWDRQEGIPHNRLAVNHANQHRNSHEKNSHVMALDPPHALGNFIVSYIC